MYLRQATWLNDGPTPAGAMAAGLGAYSYLDLLIGKPIYDYGVATVKYNTPSAWSTTAADAYSAIQYGQTPPLDQPQPAGQTPAERAAQVQAAIQAAQDNGSWSPDPSLGTSVQDVSNAVDSLKAGTNWALVGTLALGVGAGLLMLKAAK